MENKTRELKKVLEALKLAKEYFMKTNEANRALHCSETVLYSPLTTKLILAEETLNNLINENEKSN